jgi:uncharacterized membrane protein YbhN (UPF0104 family)
MPGGGSIQGMIDSLRFNKNQLKRVSRKKHFSKTFDYNRISDTQEGVRSNRSHRRLSPKKLKELQGKVALDNHQRNIRLVIAALLAIVITASIVYFIVMSYKNNTIFF